MKFGVGVSLGSVLLQLAGCDNAEIARPTENLRRDPRGICDLPPGFEYSVLSQLNTRMTDGHLVPDYMDGMACFSGPSEQLILVRNHELPVYFPFNPPSPAPEYAYDPDTSGGTTTLWLNNRLEVTRQYLSHTGTIRNCGGGTTPWGTWISCEEPGSAGWQMGKRHGYNFEVDPQAPLQSALPLTAMGRFNHEAIAVDPATGWVYQTEDDMRGCFYRFIPNDPGELLQGGRLQALKFVDPAIKHTSEQTLTPNQAYPCTWVDIDEPDPADNTLALEAQAKGAAVFVRGEGMAVADAGIYFACTNGGKLGKGQIFKYTPEPDSQTGNLELVYEVLTPGVLEDPDNLTLSPWGDLIICEDNGLEQQCLMGLTPQGNLYTIAANSQSEWAGACFSPRGDTLFANIFSGPAMTLAIRGPWSSLRHA
ncbi:MAG: alkaline phosphatase PhoX [Pseudomonadota bacterium]